jgi:phospholipase/carboxylesterase
VIPPSFGTDPISRRRALQLGAAVAIATVTRGCSGDVQEQDARAATDGARMKARPNRKRAGAVPGLADLALDANRQCLLYVPPSYSADRPAPFVLGLHGATQRAAGHMNLFRPYAEAAGLILLAVDSNGTTWDAIRGDFGVDIALIDAALAKAFDRCSVDPARVCVEGFSDGATYAVALGRANGDLFRRTVAFSPGFLIPAEPHDKTRFFISHGTRDSILPIDRAGRPVAAELRREGFEVDFLEFDGPHTVPPDIARAAAIWIADG